MLSRSRQGMKRPFFLGFVSKLRIALYVSQVNDLSDNSFGNSRHWMHLARTLERTLTSIASGMRDSPASWDPTVEFVHLCLLLNLYSICLRRASAISLSDPDHAAIQSSAAHVACQMIELFAKSPQSADKTSPYPQQRYLAKYYVQFHTIALLMLA